MSLPHPEMSEITCGGVLFSIPVGKINKKSLWTSLFLVRFQADSFSYDVKNIFALYVNHSKTLSTGCDVRRLFSTDYMKATYR